MFDVSFANCTSLTSTAYWFYKCSKLTSIEGIKNLKTNNVADMSSMFYSCFGLTSLDVSGFKTDNVNNMSDMFSDCSSLTSLDVSGFNTDNVTSMSSMFSGCSNLTNLDVSGFKTDKVTYMNFMFSRCSGLTSLDVSGFKTDNVTNMSYMFSSCSSLTSLDVSGFNTDNVTSMSSMFSGCSNLTNLDVSGFKTDKVTYMNFMFSRCSGLTSLDVSGFKTDNVTNMSYMFSSCSSLTSLDMSGFKTDNVTNMSYMFSRCSSLTSLDVSGFKTDNVTNMEGMFNNCSKLRTIYIDDEKWSTANVTNSNNMFYSCNNIIGGNGTMFDSNHVDASYAHIDGGSDNPGYFTAAGAEPWNGPMPYAALSDNNTVLTFYYDSQKEERGGMSVGTFYNSSTWSQTPNWYDQRESITTVVFDASFADFTTLTSTAYWFYKCSKLTSIEGINNLKTENVTDMGSMFYGCSSLTSLDVSGFKTDKVTDMSSMFSGCSGLTSLDVSEFKTDNVTNMYYMFYSCSNLTSIDVNGFETDNVTSMVAMFRGCASLTSIDVSGFKTDNVTSMRSMFDGCYTLTSLDVSGFKTDNVTSMSSMFSGCSSLTSLDVSGFKTDNVTDMGGMFGGCSNLSTIYVDEEKWNTANVKYTDDMFYNCTNIIGGSGTIYNGNLVDATYAHIDGGSADPGYFTAAGTEPWNGPVPYAALSDDNTILTFYYDTQKEERDGMIVGTFTEEYNYDTWNWEPTTSWYDQRESITTVVFDASFAEYTSLTSTAYWFYNCSKLTSIEGINNLNTDNVTDMSYMFYNCSSLRSLELSGFKTDNVTDMSYMFYNCSSLRSLNVSGFKTDNVTNMRWMFFDCSRLMSLDVSGFKTNNVTSMYYMFFGCRNLTNLDVSGFETDNVTNMWGMFGICSNLTSLDVSGFKTDNVTQMGQMFYLCSSLTSLDVSSFNTDKVINMYDMFRDCTSMRTIYVDEEKWSTANVTYSDDMFYNCTNIIGGSGTIYNGNLVDATYAHIDGGSADPGYFTAAGAEPWNGPLPYAVLSDDNTVLTFYYDTQKEKRGGLRVGSFDYMSQSWYEERESITTVVFDASFADCTSLTSTAYWFYNCSELTSIEGIKNLKTDNVMDMSHMFRECCSLTSLDLSGFKTDNVTNMEEMFEDCYSLTSLDVSGFKTDNVTDMGGMFYYCSSLTSLDVRGFKTDKVKYMNSMFSGCSSLASLDVSGFKTDNVTSMGGMFEDCSNLSTIYVDEEKWSTVNVTDNASMFFGCTSLVGGNGTAYDGIHVDVEYARIDMEGQPGYFTDINDKKEDLVLEPLEEDETIDFGEEGLIDEQTNLNGNIVGDLFFNISNENGSYDAEESCIVINNATNDEVMATIEDKDFFDPTLREQFTGLIFKVPSGSGKVKVTAQTTGNMVLKVKIGSGEPIEMELEGKLKVSFPYNVTEETLVYIYAGENSSASVKGMHRATGEDAGSLKIYGISIATDLPTGIAAVRQNASPQTIYTLSGQRLSQPQRGVNIIDGKKVLRK